MINKDSWGLFENRKSLFRIGSTEVQTGEFKGYGALFKKRIVVKSSPVDACFCVN
jgi:hypothetical protein